MSVYQFYNPAPVFFDLLGIAPVAGGSLAFYEISTTTPKDTWSDVDMTMLNVNPIPLDASGRSSLDIFMDGDYTVICRNGDGATVWTRDIPASAAAGASIPALVSGAFLTNDGTNLSWADILQIPDPSGSSDKVLGTDGANLIWVSQPTIPAPVVNVTTTAPYKVELAMSDGTYKYVRLFGSGTAPASGNKGTSVDITFGVTFAKLFGFQATLNITAATPSGALVDIAAPFTIGGSSSGLNVSFNVSDDDSNSAWKISNPINFNWVAEGLVAL